MDDKCCILKKGDIDAEDDSGGGGVKWVHASHPPSLDPLYSSARIVHKSMCIRPFFGPEDKAFIECAFVNNRGEPEQAPH